MGGEWFVLYLVEEQSMELEEEEFALLHLEVWWCGCVVVCGGCFFVSMEEEELALLHLEVWCGG